MNNILNTVHMAQPVFSSANPEDEPRPSPLARAKEVAGRFLCHMLHDVRRVNTIKLVQIDAEHDVWEVEAEVYLPNATIYTLGLPVTREVLDCQLYLLRLDSQLNVIAYGLKALIDEPA